MPRSSAVYHTAQAVYHYLCYEHSIISLYVSRLIGLLVFFFQLVLRT